MVFKPTAIAEVFIRLDKKFDVMKAKRAISKVNSPRLVTTESISEKEDMKGAIILAWAKYLQPYLTCFMLIVLRNCVKL